MDTSTIIIIVKRSLNKKIKNIKPILGKGDVNEIYIIDIGNKKILLRINSKEDGLSEFKKEEWCINEAKKKGVLCSNILDIGKYKKYCYMIYDFIDGKSGKEIKNKLKVWTTIGKYAKLINSIKVKGYGLRFSPKDNKFTESWKKYIDYNIDSLVKRDKLIELKVYNENQLPIINKFFLNLKRKKIKVGLVHNDLSLRNVVVDKEGNVFLIDWGCAEANFVPHGEFVEILGAGHMDLKIPTENQIGCFLEGYGLSKIEFEKLKKEISKFLLLVSFDKLRWAIDKSPKDIDGMIKIAKRRLDYALKING